MGLIIAASHELALKYSGMQTSGVQIIGTLRKSLWHFTDVLVHCLKCVKAPLAGFEMIFKVQEPVTGNLNLIASNA